MHAPLLIAFLNLSGMFDRLVHFVGTVVIIASVIWSAYCLASYLIRRLSPAALPASTPPRPTPRTVAAALPEPNIPDRLIAVIAAAVYSALDDKHRIISIKPQDTSWEKAGRQAVLTSHRIR